MDFLNVKRNRNNHENVATVTSIEQVREFFLNFVKYYLLC